MGRHHVTTGIDKSCAIALKNALYWLATGVWQIENSNVCLLKYFLLQLSAESIRGDVATGGKPSAQYTF